MTRRTLIFVGPTLPAAEVARLAPQAEVRPPAACGDILRALSNVNGRNIARVTCIALIDGYFERMAAVWHKELLLALEQGIAVYGAASMGALRAAELDAFGMIGVGAIYNAYRRGALTCDDEVAVAHLPASAGYRAVSDALVNLRDGLALASRARVISPRTRDALIELARARFYRERSWSQLILDGNSAQLPARQLAALAAWPKPDRKATDARLLLAALARAPGHAAPRVRVPRTWALRRFAAQIR